MAYVVDVKRYKHPVSLVIKNLGSEVEIIMLEHQLPHFWTVRCGASHTAFLNLQFSHL